MADRMLETSYDEVPEIPEILEKVLVFALQEAREKMEKGEEIVPFTALVVKENLFMESHPGDTTEECFNYARHTVEGARGADAYAFCYDGYIDTDHGMKDAIIAEGGVPGADEGFAAGYLYTTDDSGNLVFEKEIAYIGEAPNYMSRLRESEEYGDDEIDSRYLDEDSDEFIDADEAHEDEEYEHIDGIPEESEPSDEDAE